MICCKRITFDRYKRVVAVRCNFFMTGNVYIVGVRRPSPASESGIQGKLGPGIRLANVAFVTCFQRLDLNSISTISSSVLLVAVPGNSLRLCTVSCLRSGPSTSFFWQKSSSRLSPISPIITAYLTTTKFYSETPSNAGVDNFALWAHSLSRCGHRVSCVSIAIGYARLSHR